MQHQPLVVLFLPPSPELSCNFDPSLTDVIYSNIIFTFGNAMH